MMEEMKGEVMELVVTACEKHSTNNEVSILTFYIMLYIAIHPHMSYVQDTITALC
jgi:hypothetical protein